MKIYEYKIQTHVDQCFIDVSEYVRKSIVESDIICGKVTLFCPHTTAGITINENADPDVVSDMIRTLNKIFPIVGDYDHYEGNSHAHLKSSFVGTDQTLLVKDGQPLLGIWQSPYFCEFDGPRQRTLIIGIEGVQDE